MRLLLLFTSYRQVKEFDYQKKFLEKSHYISRNFDVLLHCNNSKIDKKIIQSKLEKLPCKKYQIFYGSNQGGYLRGQFQAIVELFREGFLMDYDFIIHLHPDIFIIDEKFIVKIINQNCKSNYNLFVSRVFGNNNESFATDFFIFKPSIDIAKIFESYKNYPQEFMLPLEEIFYQSIKNNNINYIELERFKAGHYFRDIDSLGLWHEHRLSKVDLYFKIPHMRYLYTILDLVKNPRFSSCIIRDFVIRKWRNEKQDNLLSLLSR